VFYLDHANTINNLVREKDVWRVGDLGHRGVVAAQHSKLAAVTMPNSGTTTGEVIHIFYQSTDKTGAIREIRGYDGHWQPIAHNRGGHPLLGTSLAAVPPLACINIAETSEPVVFFQEENLRLVKLQGSGITTSQHIWLSDYSLVLILSFYSNERTPGDRPGPLSAYASRCYHHQR
jgi:hypothetical protein